MKNEKQKSPYSLSLQVGIVAMLMSLLPTGGKYYFWIGSNYGWMFRLGIIELFEAKLSSYEYLVPILCMGFFTVIMSLAMRSASIKRDVVTTVLVWLCFVFSVLYMRRGYLYIELWWTALPCAIFIFYLAITYTARMVKQGAAEKKKLTVFYVDDKYKVKQQDVEVKYDREYR